MNSSTGQQGDYIVHGMMCSYFLEDCFDEWLWAPAMYFRWAFNMDGKRR